MEFSIWTACTLFHGLSGSCAYLSVGWSCRLTILEILSPKFCFLRLSFPMYSASGLWRFSKVRTHLIEVDYRLHPSFLRLSFTLDIHWIIVVPWTTFSQLTAFPTWLRPPLQTTANILNTRATGFLLVNDACPVVLLPPHGHHTLERYYPGSISTLIITLPSFGGIDLISPSFVFGRINKVNDSCIALLTHQANLGRTKSKSITWTINWNIKKPKEMIQSCGQIARDMLKSMSIMLP